MVSLCQKAASEMTGWVKVSFSRSRKNNEAIVENEEESVAKQPSRENRFEIFFDTCHAETHCKLCGAKDDDEAKRPEEHGGID